jgi:DNA-binding NtrC family response regulator
VNVRVIAATSRDIRKMVEQGTFREDLYYRLNVVTVTLPQLRERPDDIPLLVEHFLKEIAENKHTAPKRVSPEVMRRLVAYRWPGNVRDLRNALESMMVLAEGELLTERDLPERISEGMAESGHPRQIPTGLTMDELEKLAIMKALDECGGNRTHAAGRLKISVRTLQRKLQHYQLEGRVAPPPPAPADIVTPA